jgi:hypothetical protein
VLAQGGAGRQIWHVGPYRSSEARVALHGI